MNKYIGIFLLSLSLSCFSEELTFTLFEEITIDLPDSGKFKGKKLQLREVENQNFQLLLDSSKEVKLELPYDVSFELSINDNGETSSKMNALSRFNWLTAISGYKKILKKQVMLKQQQGYKTVSSLSGDKVGQHRAIISRVGWLVDGRINNLLIFDIFHTKAMLSIKLSWISDPETSAEKIADQLITSISN